MSACHKVPVGYLQVESAEFIPNKVTVYKEIDPNSVRAIQKSPWSSLAIAGVAGTAPINYEIGQVKSTNPAGQPLIEAAMTKGWLEASGGCIRLYQDAVKTLPAGEYIITLRIYNEGYSFVKPDIFTFVVVEGSEPSEDIND